MPQMNQPPDARSNSEVGLQRSVGRLQPSGSVIECFYALSRGKLERTSTSEFSERKRF